MLGDYTRIADPQFVSLSAAPLFTNPEKNTVFLKGVMLYNSSASTRNVSFHQVPASGISPGAASTLNEVFEIDLAPYQTYCFDLSYPLVLTDEGDTFQASCSADSTVSINLLGVSAPSLEVGVAVPLLSFGFNSLPPGVAAS